MGKRGNCNESNLRGDGREKRKRPKGGAHGGMWKRRVLGRKRKWGNIVKIKRDVL